VVSELQITLKNKAQADEEGEAYRIVCEHSKEACNTVIEC